MNKIFKLVWNSTLNAWVVASELATAKIKSSTLDSACKKLSSARLPMARKVWRSVKAPLRECAALTPHVL